jgi:hypothetical protein
MVDLEVVLTVRIIVPIGRNAYGWILSEHDRSEQREVLSAG